MMKKGMKKNKILDLLYRSFEEELEEEEQKQLEDAIKNFEELRREKEQISVMRKTVSDSAARSFKPFFAERVMNQIIAAEEKEGTLAVIYEPLKAVFQRLAIAGAIVMIALIVYNLGIGESLTMDEVFYMSELTFEEIFPIPLF